MFPPSLATGPFSLRAGRDCCAVSVGARLNADGSLAPDVVVTPSALRPAQRLTYDDADAALAAGSDADLTALAEARPQRLPLRPFSLPCVSCQKCPVLWCDEVKPGQGTWPHDLMLAELGSHSKCRRSMVGNLATAGPPLCWDKETYQVGYRPP